MSLWNSELQRVNEVVWLSKWQSKLLVTMKLGNVSQLFHELHRPIKNKAKPCVFNFGWPLNRQGFWNFTRSRSREIQVYPRNTAKLTKTREIPRNSLEILPNTCRYNIFETYLGHWSCLLAVNLQIYLEISSLPRINNVQKYRALRKTQ